MSKCECKNCVHNDVCKTREFPSIDEILKDGCHHYKDKSLFVEIPCKKGGHVWFNTFKKNATVCVGVQPHTVDRIDIVLVCDTKNLIETKIYDWEIGKTVFLTKKEAKQKLKKGN